MYSACMCRHTGLASAEAGTLAALGCTHHQKSTLHRKCAVKHSEEDVAAEKKRRKQQKKNRKNQRRHPPLLSADGAYAPDGTLLNFVAEGIFEASL